MIETTRVVLFEEAGDQTFTISYAIEWLQGLLNNVPMECRGDTLFEIEGGPDLDREYCEALLTISYTRRSTNDEIDKRLAEAVKVAAQREKRFRDVMAKWSKGFGND